MANRVILGLFSGSYRLRISRPGFNVLSTTLTNNQLAFDSTWSGIGSIIQKGVGILDSSGNFTTPLIGTFATPPMVMAIMYQENFGVPDGYVLLNNAVFDFFNPYDLVSVLNGNIVITQNDAFEGLSVQYYVFREPV